MNTSASLLRHSRLGWQRVGASSSRILLAAASSNSSCLDVVYSSIVPSHIPTTAHITDTTCRRWNSTSNSNTAKDEKEEEETKKIVTLVEDEKKLLYTSSMGGLITRLKIVSITSCFMSIVGLPLLIYLKNGDWPNMQQMGLGGVAFMGATGSTLALHFVFGPYILELYEIPIKEEDENETQTEEKAEEQRAAQEFVYKATTRSVFGWKKEHVFDPLTDVTHYAGMRPFANFVAKDMTLYAHPHLLDDDTRVKLLHSTKTEEEVEAEKKEESKKRKEDDDDGFVL